MKIAKFKFALKIVLLILLLLFAFYKKEPFTNSNINYTIKGKNDGFGAQYQAIMSGIALCKYKNYNYIHTPMKEIEHGADPIELNKFIGIPKHNNLKNQKIDKHEQYSREVHCSSNPDKYYTPEVLKIISDYYYSTPKPTIKNKNYIAIHIRRGDVSESSYQERFVDNNYYLKLAKRMKKQYPNKEIKIFSQGKEEDFAELSKFCTLELNTDLQYTFHSMVEASVLITAKSSLSYAAALINKNKIYYIPFHHKPLKKWEII